MNPSHSPLEGGPTCVCSADVSGVTKPAPPARCAASSPVQKEEPLLAPAQAGAELQAVVVGRVNSGCNSNIRTFNRKEKVIVVFSLFRSSLVQFLQEGFDGSAAHIHHLQDHYDVVSRRNLHNKQSHEETNERHFMTV